MTTPRKPRFTDNRRARFALEYAKDLNGAQAAIRAGYSPRAAKVTASRLLTDTNLRARIDELLRRAAEAAAITVERTQKEIARIAYGDIRKLFDKGNGLREITELDEDATAMVAAIEIVEEYQGRGESRELVRRTYKIKTRDKLKALDMCMSILGMHRTAQPGESGGLHLTIHPFEPQVTSPQKAAGPQSQALAAPHRPRITARSANLPPT